MTVQLSVVIPVLNEERSIAAVVEEWTAELARLGIRHEIRLYDDGSSDGTGEILRRLQASRREIVVSTHSNRGHGPTVLRGYREAEGEWVLQIDADDEIGPRAFEELWNRRERNDFLLGRRQGRPQGPMRRALSATARWTVRLGFGGSVRDVNSPYRLMRRKPLVALLRHLDPGTFAPNVALTGLAIAAGLRLEEVGVATQPARARRSSLRGRTLLLAGLRSLAGTLAAAFRQRVGSTRGLSTRGRR